MSTYTITYHRLHANHVTSSSSVAPNDTTVIKHSLILNDLQGYNSYHHSPSITHPSPSHPSIYPSSTPIHPSNTHNLSLINDVYQYIPTYNTYNSTVTSVYKEINTTNTSENHTQLALFGLNKNIIKVPSKVHYNLKRYTPKKLLKKIHPNIEVAIEYCLLFTTNLTSTYFTFISDHTADRWKSLKAEYLRDYLNHAPETYKLVREALEYPLKNGAIIECDYKYFKGEKCFHYRLGEAYFGKGIVDYTLTTTEARKAYNKHLFDSYSRSKNNPICRNLLEFYSNITLPTTEEIMAEAKQLVQQKYKTKKGKKLTFLNKHKPSFYKKPQERSFVQHNIALYNYLTENGLMIPEEGNEASGGRVVDSFTLMPSWIRNLVKVDGQPFAECDLVCFHPNIAQYLYGGSKEFIQHKDIAADLGIDVSTVKVEHLSFFNKEVWQMKQSPLYTYYMTEDPSMMKKIITEKHQSPYKHKTTSRNLFKKEVEIMTEVIVQLNKEGIYVGYVYDALFCKATDTPKVKQVMDTVVLKHGVKTTAKVTYLHKSASLEQFKPIVGFENIYVINLDGTIKNINNNSTNTLTTRVDRAGYKTVRLSKNGKTHTKYIHRLIATSFIPNPYNKPEVNHKDGNKLNNAVANLEWVTHAENVQHAYKNQLIPINAHYKKVIDCTTWKTYKSVKEASEKKQLPYSTVKNFLNANRKNNNSGLMYFENWKLSLFETIYPYHGLSVAFQFLRILELSVDAYALAS